jgi:hypothetical protein
MVDFPAAVARYALRFHEVLGNRQHIASPLSAYLLLSLIAPVTAGDDRGALEQVLGLPVDEARRAMAMLLRFPHPAAQLAIAAWHEAVLEGAPIGDWLRELPSGVGRTGIPTQAELDRWCHQATHGLIPRFPGGLDERTVLVLGSALASRERWFEPFEVVGSDRLGTHSWPSLRSALHRPKSGPAIIRTAAAGLVGASIATSWHSLLVVSVVAEPSVTSTAAIAAAHEVARLRSHLPSDATAVSLFDLPFDGHAWTITESTTEARVPGGQVETAEVVIPAWTARTDSLDLADDPAFGFGPTRNALQRAMPPNPDGYDIVVRHSATATFGRYGFEAAGATSIAALLGLEMPPEHRGLLRHATVRFTRPFAVVAVVAAPDTQWNGVPVFSGWITTPVEADEADTASAPF